MIKNYTALRTVGIDADVILVYTVVSRKRGIVVVYSYISHSLHYLVTHSCIVEWATSVLQIICPRVWMPISDVCQR